MNHTLSDVDQVPRVVRQLRRAQRLAHTLETAYPSPAWALTRARQLDDDGWALVAQHAAITKPSPDTTALAVELLRQHAEDTDAAGQA